MVRRCRMPVLLSAVILLVAGCESAPKPLAATSSQTVVLDGTAKRTTITANLAEELTLSLPPTEKPGYGWRLVGHDSRMLRQTMEIVPASDPAGSSTVKFVTQRFVSRTSIRFVLVRNAREDEVLDSHEVVVSVVGALPKK